MSLKCIYTVLDGTDVIARFVYVDDARAFCRASEEREPHRVLALVNDAAMLYEVYGTTPTEDK